MHESYKQTEKWISDDTDQSNSRLKSFQQLGGKVFFLSILHMLAPHMTGEGSKLHFACDLSLHSKIFAPRNLSWTISVKWREERMCKFVWQHTGFVYKWCQCMQFSQQPRWAVRIDNVFVNTHTRRQYLSYSSFLNWKYYVVHSRWAQINNQSSSY